MESNMKNKLNALSDNVQTNFRKVDYLLRETVFLLHNDRVSHTQVLEFIAVFFGFLKVFPTFLIFWWHHLQRNKK